MRQQKSLLLMATKKLTSITGMAFLIPLASVLISCSSADKNLDKPAEKTTAAVTEKNSVTTADQTNKEKNTTPETPVSDEVKVELQKISQIKSESIATEVSPSAPPISATLPPATSSHSDPSTSSSSANSSHASGHSSSDGVDPEKSLGWLKNGNTRYRKGFLRKDGQSKKDIERLSTGQKPHAIILSCSDSRVPPEIVFDQKLGEIFVVRTAGQSLDPNAIGSIEYAVEHLGSKLIVVMGHTSCGAVKAALSTINGADAGSPALNHLVADIHPRLQSFKSSIPTKDVQPESWANAKGVARDLVAQSKILSEKLRSGEIKIISALYHLGSGEVQFE